MSDPFIGEIRIFAGNFAPRGWAMCDGQLLAISTNTALFSLIGTIYGGDGRTTFALPDMRGRAPMHQGQGPGLSHRPIGQRAGTEMVTLTTGQMPSHDHPHDATGDRGDQTTPIGHFLAADSDVNAFVETNPNTAMSGNMVQILGGSQAHENRMPYLAINFVIATVGIYPSRS